MTRAEYKLIAETIAKVADADKRCDFCNHLGKALDRRSSVFNWGEWFESCNVDPWKEAYDLTEATS